MRTYKSIEKKSHIAGMPVQDLLLLSILMVILIILGVVVNMVIKVPKIYYLSVIFLDIIFFLILKRVNRKKHPSYLFSFLSFHLVQPRRIYLHQSINISTYDRKSKLSEKQEVRQSQ